MKGPNSVAQSAKLFERRKKVVSDGVGIFVPITVDKAHGSKLTDVDGKHYIDLGGGIGVLNAGHTHPKVVKAIADQAEKLIHACFHVSAYEPYVALCEQLVKLLPHGPETKAMLTNTGAESVENAIKIARQATKRSAVICFSDAFHGRTLMGMSLTSKINYKLNCGPFAPEIYRIEFPNYYRNGAGLSLEEFSAREMQRLDSFTHTHVDADSVAAIIIEPVQGEGGFNVAPAPYIKSLRKFCDDHNILLIFDEVQTGFGRTGKWGAYQHYGIEPDLSTWAKSLGSGMPIGAVVGKKSVMDAAAPGTIGGTYLGNPVCCAAALATIEVMKEEKLNERALVIGSVVQKRFSDMAKWADCIGDVRGLGAMVAMEFVKNSDPKSPDSETCDKLVQKCLDRGVILLKAGGEKNVIRVLSPLSISDQELGSALDIIEKSLKEILGK